MSLRNENIALLVGISIFLLGYVLTDWDPGRGEALLIAVLMFGTAFVISDYLNQRDDRRGREPQRLPFRR